MVMNDLPAFSDYARALTPRTSIIYFPLSYVGREDRGLKPRLETIARNGRLVNWALRGLKDLRTRKRFIDPTASVAMTRRFELSTSPVLLFTEECCKRSSEYRISRRELYDAYRAWTKEQGGKQGMSEQFTRWLLSAVPEVTITRHRESGDDTDRPYFFGGITLTERARGMYLK
jgi:putative DNA primase/helicase